MQRTPVGEDFLANDIVNLRRGRRCELGRKGIGSDPRIGNKFIYPGIGIEGLVSKDVKDYSVRIMETTHQNSKLLRQ